MKKIFDAANNLRKEVQATYKSMFGNNTHAAIEAEKAIIKLQEELIQKLSQVNTSSPIIGVQNEVNYIDQITTAVSNAANTGFENGQLVIAAFSGITKQIADRFNDVVWNVCRTVSDRRYYESSSNFGTCVQIGENYLPYVLALSTLAVVVTTVARTEIVKMAAVSLIDNLNTAMENIKNTVKTAVMPASTEKSESVNEESTPGYLSQLATRFECLSTKYAHITIEIIEAQEHEVKSEITGQQPAVDDTPPVEPEPNYPSIFYGR